MAIRSPNDGPAMGHCSGRYPTPSCGRLKTQEECDASVVDAPTCASLACMESVGDKGCSINNDDPRTCVETFMLRATGQFSPCLYDDSVEGDRYKPNDDPPYDARCY